MGSQHSRAQTVMGPERVAHLIQTHLPSRGCASFSSSGKRGCGGEQEHTSTQGLSHLFCTPRCSNRERRPRPLRSAPACWSTPPPRGSRRWKPAPTASSMNCDVLEPSSPTTAHSPRSSISVLAVRAQPGIWGAGGAARDGKELGVEDRSRELSVGCKTVLGLRKYTPDAGRPQPTSSALCDLPC